MKNQCQHTGQNAAFKLLFSRIPIREILKKDEKTIDFGRRIWISPELFPEKVKQEEEAKQEAKNRIAEIQEKIGES